MSLSLFSNASTPAVRRYLRRVTAAMAAYVLILIASLRLAGGWQLEGPLLYLLALLPAAPLLGVIAALALYLREEKDEYVRVTAVKAMLAALGFMLCASTIWGFLETFGAVPHMPAYWAFLLWAIGLGIANIWWRWPE